MTERASVFALQVKPAEAKGLCFPEVRCLLRGGKEGQTGLK